MPNTPEYDRWFREEVQVHREALRAWLGSHFASLRDLDNVVQETMVRVWRVRLSKEVPSPRALLFATAHNLAVDQLRREKIVPMDSLTEVARLPVYEERPSPAEASVRQQEIEFLKQAIQSLPTKCRQVLTLRKIYGLSQKEIAAQLGISEHTVEAQVANGMRRCAAYLARLGLP
ncbi:MAG TPA: RNA polymerase sigma factor [Opitutaceae bacterium]